MSKAKLDICTKSNINQARHDKPSSQKRYKKYFPTNQSMSLLTNVFPMKNQLKNKKKLMRNNLSLRSKQQRSVSFSIKKFRTTRATIQSRLQRKIRKNKTINRKYSLQSAITHNRNASHVKRNSILGTTTRLSIKKTRTKGISNNTSLAQINSNTAFHYKQQQSTCENLTPLIYIQKQQNVTNITNRALLQDLNRLDRYWDENSDQIVKVIDRVEQKSKNEEFSLFHESFFFSQISVSQPAIEAD
ncbi:unnamed protein product [Didymodactylos carnosus]|uniref:Uncharacterized protein n=1 Tax=Didymodactylos carnosus TaxID=1234261 RepID=A0A815HZ75_9BILA|nr:unnamed protein product [Didymodactylos carnosus]CAF1359348.1 unnamed protein product [Didymodactylos carnosus]CAF4140765.1 unnamed protein product [Didymodactylos carnosus]CAF4236409.1 unnamed protein product [Didymodactylos carnosus]